ncbi:MAG: galactokinase, partial [Verrucomicrobiota bacterium]
FGTAPALRVRAPGRVNLIGELVDYVGGLVLPVAIDRAIHAAAAPNGTSRLRLVSEVPGVAAVEVPVDALGPRAGADHWLNYVLGVLAQYRDRGWKVPGLDVLFAGDLPLGAGLSSSAALETATALLLEGLSGRGLDPIGRARLCQQAEHGHAGVPCGLMDQLAVGAGRAGHALLIACRDLRVTPVPLPPDWSIVVADTRVKHELADGEYRRRREDCEAAARALGVSTLRDANPELLAANAARLDERLARRARHAVTEIARVPAFVAAAAAGDAGAAGELLRASHLSLRDDFEVSCPELDALAEAAWRGGAALGVIGARMTGGGFGGATITLVRRGREAELARHLEVDFAGRFGHTPSVFVTRAAGAAEILPPDHPAQ